MKVTQVVLCLFSYSTVYIYHTFCGSYSARDDLITHEVYSPGAFSVPFSRDYTNGPPPNYESVTSLPNQGSLPCPQMSVSLPQSNSRPCSSFSESKCDRSQVSNQEMFLLALDQFTKQFETFKAFLKIAQTKNLFKSTEYSLLSLVRIGAGDSSNDGPVLFCEVVSKFTGDFVSCMEESITITKAILERLEKHPFFQGKISESLFNQKKSFDCALERLSYLVDDFQSFVENNHEVLSNTPHSETKYLLNSSLEFAYYEGLSHVKKIQNAIIFVCELFCCERDLCHPRFSTNVAKIKDLESGHIYMQLSRRYAYYEASEITRNFIKFVLSKFYVWDGDIQMIQYNEELIWEKKRYFERILACLTKHKKVYQDKYKNRTKYPNSIRDITLPLDVCVDLCDQIVQVFQRADPEKRNADNQSIIKEIFSQRLLKEERSIDFYNCLSLQDLKDLYKKTLVNSVMEIKDADLGSPEKTEFAWSKIITRTLDKILRSSNKNLNFTGDDEKSFPSLLFELWKTITISGTDRKKYGGFSEAFFKKQNKAEPGTKSEMDFDAFYVEFYKESFDKIMLDKESNNIPAYENLITKAFTQGDGKPPSGSLPAVLKRLANSLRIYYLDLYQQSVLEYFEDSFQRTGRSDLVADLMCYFKYNNENCYDTLYENQSLVEDLKLKLAVVCTTEELYSSFISQEQCNFLYKLDEDYEATHFLIGQIQSHLPGRLTLIASEDLKIEELKSFSEKLRKLCSNDSSLCIKILFINDIIRYSNLYLIRHAFKFDSLQKEKEPWTKKLLGSSRIEKLQYNTGILMVVDEAYSCMHSCYKLEQEWKPQSSSVSSVKKPDESKLIVERLEKSKETLKEIVRSYKKYTANQSFLQEQNMLESLDFFILFYTRFSKIKAGLWGQLILEDEENLELLLSYTFPDINYERSDYSANVSSVKISHDEIASYEGESMRKFRYANYNIELVRLINQRSLQFRDALNYETTLEKQLIGLIKATALLFNLCDCARFCYTSIKSKPPNPDFIIFPTGVSEVEQWRELKEAISKRVPRIIPPDNSLTWFQKWIQRKKPTISN